MIDQFIEAPELISILKHIAIILRPYKDVQFYTDSSLQWDPSFIDSIGISWININQENVQFSASAILWPSSTKAEMLAYFSTLIVASPKAQVTIFTDSVATIAGFDKLNTFMQLSVRKKEKTPNFQIWMTIDYIIRTLDLKVKMVKVKAHSGDWLNDKADRLAKAAVFAAPRLNLKYTNLPELSLVLTCDNLIIEASSQKSIKCLFNARYFYETL